MTAELTLIYHWTFYRMWVIECLVKSNFESSGFLLVFVFIRLSILKLITFIFYLYQIVHQEIISEFIQIKNPILKYFACNIPICTFFYFFQTFYICKQNILFKLLYYLVHICIKLFIKLVQEITGN